MAKRPGRQAEAMVADGARWRKVSVPRVWRPIGEGETLIGTYVGRRTRQGSTGIYDVFLIQDEHMTHELSGTVLRNLFDGGVIQEGARVRVVFKGLRQGTTNQYKDFEMYVQDT